MYNSRFSGESYQNDQHLIIGGDIGMSFIILFNLYISSANKYYIHLYIIMHSGKKNKHGYGYWIVTKMCTLKRVYWILKR
jgi:hypothetical protein